MRAFYPTWDPETHHSLLPPTHPPIHQTHSVQHLIRKLEKQTIFLAHIQLTHPPTHPPI